MKQRILKVSIIILLIMVCSKGQIVFAAPDFPGVLDGIFSHLTETIYEKYVKKGYQTIVFLPVVSRGSFETTLSYNCNLVLIDRLKRRIESSSAEDPSLQHPNVEIMEGGFADHGNKQSVFLRVEPDDINVNGKSFELKILLKEILTTGDDVIIDTLRYSGRDENIQHYVTEKTKMSLIVWVFIGIIGLVLIFELFRLISRKRILRPENYPFWRMAIISLLMILIFCTVLFFIKRDAIEGHAYFEGAEVHFFIDRNSGLFFDAGENNFVDLIQGILHKTFNRISHQILYPDTPELEKQGDLLTRFINWMLETLGLEKYRLKKFHQLKQSDYTYSIYTFSEENIELKKAGNLAELVVNYEPIIADVLESIKPERRESSLIKPLLALYDKLAQSKQETKPKKKFIIIFSDAAEIFLDNVKSFMKNVNRFYSRKDQYLRVFSVLFPNIPRISSDLQIYPYEEGKLLLLSKISEFIVYMNDTDAYTPGKLRKVNDLFYEKLRAHFPRNPSTEADYERRLSEYERLKSYMKEGELLDIHQIAGQNFLKNFVEIDTFKRKNQNKDYPSSSDFFLYTYVTGLYKLKNLDYENRRDWIAVENYKEARREKFGQPLDPGRVNDAINDITDTFVNQFIIIDKEMDKEALVSKINFFITIFAVFFSLLYAWILYRYKYDVNYRIEKKDHVINIASTGVILIIMILSMVYFRYENRWTLYGSWVWAFLVSLVFLFSYYYLPLIFSRWLPAVLLRVSQAARGMFRREPLQNHMHYHMHDATFAFDEMGWIKWVDRALFNLFIAPLLGLSLFLQILSPVYKKGTGEMKDPFISFMDTLFKNILNLSNYNKIIEWFIILWMIVVGVYFIRALFIHSDTARAVK